jgi:hypothetical protein
MWLEAGGRNEREAEFPFFLPLTNSQHVVGRQGRGIGKDNDNSIWHRSNSSKHRHGWMAYVADYPATSALMSHNCVSAAFLIVVRR